MTEQETAAEPVQIPELPVIFQGREIYVRMPTPEQLLVWQRTVRRLKDSPINASWTGEEVLAALDRLRRIVDSIIVNQADILWMDDQFLDLKLDFQTLSPIIALTVDAFTAAAESEDPANRADRRAAGRPAKKASRKKSS